MTEANEGRTATDSMGELRLPAHALWGAQTQRAVQNFPISGLTLPRPFLRALGLIKASTAEVNAALGLLDERLAKEIIRAAMEVADGAHDEQFPVDVFQTGSGTSTNMNANEVIACLASAYSGSPVHANDHVNMGQSSNDVIPTAIHVSAAMELESALLPALQKAIDALDVKAVQLSDVVKTGRTHLMDAMPIRMDQELGGWAAQLRDAKAGLETMQPRLQALAQGGTAVGTAVNAPPEFAGHFARVISRRSGMVFTETPNHFAAQGSQDTAVAVSGQLKTLAVATMKIANDLRWMGSGPLAGLAEVRLPTLQPGSSIMPGKVNPVLPEAATMVAAQVIGNDSSMTVAGQSGNFQLNVMLPIIAYNLLQSIGLLANVWRELADKVIAGMTVNRDNLERVLAHNPVLITALNGVIGYDAGAAIAKQAYQQKRPILDVALEQTDLSEEELRQLLDPLQLTGAATMRDNTPMNTSEAQGRA